MSALVAEGLVRRVGRGRRAVLDGVGLRVEAGSVAVVLGPSGSGKSTLLRCLAGLEAFDGGQVVLGELASPPPTTRPCSDGWAWSSSRWSCSRT